MTNSAATMKLRGHVAMCPFPFTSHPANMLLLARKIAASAPDVQVSLFTTDPSASALSAGSAAAGVRIWRVDNGSALGGPIEALRRFVEVAGESLTKAMAEAEEEVGVKITCVVAEAMVAFVCRHIAEERGIKWVALWSASAGAFAAHLHTDQLRDAVAPEDFPLSPLRPFSLPTNVLLGAQDCQPRAAGRPPSLFQLRSPPRHPTISLVPPVLRLVPPDLRLLSFRLSSTFNSYLRFGMDTNANTTSISSSSASGSVSSSNPDDEKPLWEFVTRISKSKGGGNWKWSCKFCEQQKQGTYTRVRAHLLKIANEGIAPCKKVSMAKAEEMRKLEDAYNVKVSTMMPNLVSLPSGSSRSAHIGHDGGSSQAYDSFSLKKRKGDSSLAKAFDNQARDELDCIIARMFYTGGLSFSLARNPHYLNSYTFAANHSLGGYVPPGYNKLRTTLLEQEKKHVDLSLAPIKSTWRAKGVSIVTDGWSDPQRRPLINFMVCSESGPMFIKAVNCAGEVKDKKFISQLLREVIDEVGHENVVQIITDNARNCKAAGEIIEGIYPSIYWTPCVVHTLNLALKNICVAKNVNNNEETYSECHWITKIHHDVVQIKNFIVNHGMRLAIFLRFTPLKLLSVAETRFASMVIMLKRFKLVKNALEAMVVCEQWSAYREDDQTKARFAREKILSEDWWSQVDYILDFTSPMYDMIRVCDTDKPCLHLVYEMWDEMIKKVKKVIYEHENIDEFALSPFYEVVNRILVARWSKSNTPLHCLAHSLNPRYYSQDWLAEDVKRVPPHREVEISVERRKCFKRLYPRGDDYNKVMNEYASFSLEGGPFGDSDCIEMKYTMDPRNWWANFGAETPILQGLAIRLLGQPTSSSCSERNWSTYSFIHSLKRNKLNPKRAEDLVFIHNNLRLLSRKSKEYLDERTKMWDVGGDEFGSLEDTGILEFANLSLDEPQMENVFFEDNYEDNV